MRYKITGFITLIFLTMFFYAKSMDDVSEWTKALFDGLEKNDKTLIQTAINNKADINYERDTGFPCSVLCLAAFYDNLEILQLLLNNEADINMRNSFDKETTLEKMSSMHKTKIIRDQNTEKIIELLKETTQKRKLAVKTELEKYLIPVLVGIILEHEI